MMGSLGSVASAQFVCVDLEDVNGSNAIEPDGTAVPPPDACTEEKCGSRSFEKCFYQPLEASASGRKLRLHSTFLRQSPGEVDRLSATPGLSGGKSRVRRGSYKVRSRSITEIFIR